MLVLIENTSIHYDIDDTVIPVDVAANKEKVNESESYAEKEKLSLLFFLGQHRYIFLFSD